MVRVSCTVTWDTYFSNMAAPVRSPSQGAHRPAMDSKQADRIADTLEEMVFTGQFEEGQRLDETNLAKRFGVSRTPIREALQRLVVANLAEQRPRRGVFVRQPGSMTVIEMFETMAEIEGVCGRLAAERISSNALESLREANRLCQQAVDADDADAYSRHNEAFHHMIYAMAGNSFLANEARNLYRRLKPFRRVQFQMKERMLQSVAEHDLLIGALQERDADMAGQALRKHVGTQGERFFHQMAQLRHKVANRNAG